MQPPESWQRAHRRTVYDSVVYQEDCRKPGTAARVVHSKTLLVALTPGISAAAFTAA